MDCLLIYNNKEYTHAELLDYMDRHPEEFKGKHLTTGTLGGNLPFVTITMGDSSVGNITPTSADFKPENQLRDKFPEHTIVDNAHGIASEIAKNLRVENGGVLKAVQGNKTFADLVNPVILKFNKYFREQGNEENPFKKGVDASIFTDPNISAEEKKALFLNWSNVVKNWPLYEAEVKSFLKARKISFGTSEKDPSITTDNHDLSFDNKEQVTEAGINYNNRDYGIDIVKLDAKKNSPTEVRLVFDFMVHASFDKNDKKLDKLNTNNPKLLLPPTEVGSTGMDKLIGDDKFFYKVMGAMDGATNLVDMERRFRELAVKHPELVRPYKAFFGEGVKWNPKETTPEQWHMLMLFERAFTKQKPDYEAFRLNKQTGENYPFSTNSETDEKQLTSDFINNLISRYGKSDLVQVDEDGNYTFNENYKFKNDPFKNTVEFLQEAGYNFPQEVYEKLSTSDQRELANQAERLKSQLKNIKTKGNYITEDSLDTDAVGKIAKLYIKGDGVFKSSAHLSVDGEMVQNYILPNNFSRLLNKLSSLSNISELKEKYPKFNDVFCRNSLLLSASESAYIFNSKGDVAFTIKPTITDGLVTDDDRTINSAMNLGTRFMQGFNMNLGSRGLGNFYNIVPADSKSEWGAKIKHYISVNDFTSNRFQEKLSNIYKNYLADEIDLIKDFATNPNRSKYEQLNKTVAVGKRQEKIGERLRFFKQMLPTDLVERIHDYANGRSADKDMSTKDFIESIKDEFNKGLNDHFNKTIQETIDFLKDYRIITPADKDHFLFKSLNTTFINELKTSIGGGFDKINDKGRLKLTEAEIHSIVAFRNVNLVTHNIELHKVAFGDPAMYKDETKRIKLFLSGKEFTHTDGDNTRGINYSLNSNSNKVGEYTLKPGDLGYHSFSDTFDILTYDHNDRPGTSQISPNVNQYIEILGEEKGKAYTEINGIDAQSHMSLPYYREGKIKAGTWSEDQEAQYQYDMASMRIAISNRFKAGETKFAKFALEDGHPLLEESIKIRERGNPNITSAFYIDKPLGSGMYANTDTLSPFALKTSVFPLSWEVAQGKHLEDYYLRLLENNVAYAGPKSQHKVGTLATAPDLYDKATGKVGLTNDQVNNNRQTIAWEDFGKIVETVGTHDKTTLGSQLTKQDTLNLFTAGLPRDFYNEDVDNFARKQEEWNKMSDAEKSKASDYYKWFHTKNRALEALTDLGVNEVFNKLGISEGEDGKAAFSDPEKLVNFLSQEILRRELPENMKKALSTYFNKESGKIELTNALETLSNFNQLKSIINSTIDKHITSPKVNGGQRILVSAAMFDDVNSPMKAMIKTADGWKEISKKEYEQLSNKEKENVRLFSDTLKSYTLKDGKVTRMQVYLPSIFGEKLNKRIKLSDEQLFDYLNTDDGKKLLNGIGFRIPTQGQNSIDSFDIVPFDVKGKRYFMPSTHGDCIVVPAELATKVGSDFDVDKLNCYFKNFRVNKKTGFPEVIKFVEDTNNEENLKYLYYNKYAKVLKGVSAEVVNRSSELLDKILGEKGVKESIPTLEEFISANKGGDPFKLNSREAIENRYFDNLDEIVTNPKSFAQLMAPNDASEMKGYEGEVNKIKQRDLSPKERKALEDEKLAKNDIDYARLTDPLEMSKERQNFMDGKDQVDIGANSNASNAITQTSFMKLYDKVDLTQADMDLIGENDLTVKLPHNQVETLENGKKDVVSIISGGKVDGKYISDKLSQVIDGAVDAAKDPWLMRLFPSKDALSTAMFLTRLGTPMDHIVLFLHQPSILAYIKEQNINNTLRMLDPDFRIENLNPLNVITTVKEQFKTSNYSPKLGNFTKAEMENMMARYNAGKKLNVAENVMQKQILDEYIKYRIFARHLFEVQQGASWDTLDQPSPSTVYLKTNQQKESHSNNIIANPDKMISGNFISGRQRGVTKVVEAFSAIYKSSTPDFMKHIYPIWDAYVTRAISVGADTKRQIMDKAQTGFINFLTQNFHMVNGKPINSGLSALIKSEAFINVLNSAKESNKPDSKNYNLALDNLRVQYSVYSKDVKNITLSERPRDKYAADSLTESFRDLKVTHPDLYRNLVILSHLQYGITDSRLSINKYLPVEDYLQAIKGGLTHIDSSNPSLKSYIESNQFYKNNWNNDDICPRVNGRSETSLPGVENGVVFLKEKSKVSNYPVVKVKSNINPETGEEYSDEELQNLTSKGYKFKKSIRLYRRIENFDGTPVKVEKEDANGNSVISHVYKQINALGDGNNLQEYYTDNRPSIRTMHFRIEEESDENVLRNIRLVQPKEAEGDLWSKVGEHLTKEMFEEHNGGRNLESSEKSSTFASMKPAEVIHTTNIITRDYVKTNPNTLFLFGDNTIRKGLGGQAKEMRGELNTAGIATKKIPSNEPSSFMTDEELDYNKHIISGDIDNAIKKYQTGNYSKVEIPPIGVGLAKLAEKAPKTWEFLQKELKRFEDEVSFNPKVNKEKVLLDLINNKEVKKKDCK